MEELQQERFTLAKERLTELTKEEITNQAFTEYFHYEADFLLKLFETCTLAVDGSLFKMDEAALREQNDSYYAEVRDAGYEESYANPTFAVKKLGAEFGTFFAMLHTRMRKHILDAYAGRAEELLIEAELFLEITGAFSCAWQEEKVLPAYEQVKDILYWHVSDYAEFFSEKDIKESVVPEETHTYRIVMESDLSNQSYLYHYGADITDNERRTAEFLNGLPEETITTMANTFTEGYRLGFTAMNRDFSSRKSVKIIYCLGFERMIRKAVENFKALGLASIVSCRATPSNRQYGYDHREDHMLFFDRQYMNRRLETMRQAFLKYKEEAAVYGGPAVLEVFGEEPFAPVSKPETVKPDEKQQKLWTEYREENNELWEEFSKEEDTSFTIIAFPTTAIGERFQEIFADTIKINTLDYRLYQRIQQTIIDTLDTAEFVEIKGMNGNHTDLKVMLHPIKDPAKETKFENCVADVNIPVGEVFTSPKLTGTEGLLHVSRVFLRELEYRELELKFQDGMITAYSCANFAKEEENKRYIKENLLKHHDSLPMGEFAIGTNTAAYKMARKYDIGARLPILIAEKTGPHFAVGDTCYSREEDLKTYNPDGKEIIAKENEVSAKRKEAGQKAYYNCHTDITIPYDELGGLYAVQKDGMRIPIIEEGRFVLPGCEKLNKPLCE